MGDSHDAKFIFAEVVDDAIGKPSHCEAAPLVSPWRANVRMKTKEVQGSLKLGDERKTEFPAALSGIVAPPIV
jgi:hypothetical protein